MLINIIKTSIRTEKTVLFSLFFLSFLFNTLQHNSVWAASLSDLPERVVLSSEDDPYPTSALFSKKPVLIIVGSHSTTPLFTQLPYALKARNLPIVSKQFLSVAAVQKAPWFVKLFIKGKIASEKQKRDKQGASKIADLNQSKIIVDTKGETTKALGVANLAKNEYAAFVMDKKQNIQLLVRDTIVIAGNDESEYQKIAEYIIDNLQLFIKSDW
ncbi:MAG: hypothetical protein HQL69_19055 [Magnetococcales bacterium]|nr:hypothetical protein [Magnetococcales bacterium]